MIPWERPYIFGQQFPNLIQELQNQIQTKLLVSNQH